MKNFIFIGSYMALWVWPWVEQSGMAACCEVLRDNYGDLCQLLDTSSETLISFVVNLYAKRMIDMTIKLEVLRTKGYLGADTLLNHLRLMIEAKPKRFDTILEIMMKQEAAKDIAEKMKRELESAKPVSAWRTVQMVPVSADCELRVC